MNSRTRRCYGVMACPAAVTRRLRQEWEMVEMPPRWFRTVEAVRVGLARRGVAWRTERRPLAA